GRTDNNIFFTIHILSSVARSCLKNIILRSQAGAHCAFSVRGGQCLTRFLAIVNQSTFLIQKNINFPAFYALESFRFVIHRQAFVHVCN
ncbi:hypothetical protein, partial [Klebsiella pneumoniae]